MPRLFQAYVMVDWSAAAKPASGADSIWIGVIKRNVRFQLTYEAFNPGTRAEAEKILNATLDELARKDERVLVGFDFPLGFPRGTAAALKLKTPPWSAMQAFVAREVKDKPDNSNNRFQVGAKINRLMTDGPFPFWGCPARDEQTMLSARRVREHGEGDVPEMRFTDTRLKGASSIWKLYYQGSVGGQALTGIPVVKHLKDARAESVKLWPFELGWRPLAPADLDGVSAVFAEIYPSLIETRAAPGEIRDEAQIRAITQHFASLDEKNQLAGLFGPVKDDPRRNAIEGEEGWVLGALP